MGSFHAARNGTAMLLIWSTSTDWDDRKFYLFYLICLKSNDKCRFFFYWMKDSKLPSISHAQVHCSLSEELGRGLLGALLLVCSFWPPLRVNVIPANLFCYTQHREFNFNTTSTKTVVKLAYVHVILNCITNCWPS